MVDDAFVLLFLAVGRARLLTLLGSESFCSPIHNHLKGRKIHPIIVMLRALLLGAWYNLSDVVLEKHLARDVMF